MRRRHKPVSRRVAGRRCSRAGLSLLETILAIAILGTSMAILGESVRIGTMAAADAREMTMAQLLCEGKLAELASGLQPLLPTAAAPLEVAPDWQYTVQVERSAQQGLIIVSVTVTRDASQTSRPVTVTLYRWIIDPELTAQIEAAAQAAAEAEAASSSSSSSGGTGSGTGSGGPSGGR
jgi:hypothetical protein